MIIKSIIFFAIMFFVIYRFGNIVSKLVGDKEKENNLVYGFLLLIGINQIILTPCILIHTSFKIAFCLVIGIDIVTVILSYLIKEKDKKEKSKFKIDIKKENLIAILAIILVIVQIICTTLTFKENADDSYYVSLSLTNIDTDELYMTEPSMGEKVEGKMPFDVTELLPSIELQVAIWSKAFGISPAVICHSLLPCIIIVISYFAYYYLAKTFFKDKKYAQLFLLVLEIVFLFTGFSNRFRPGYLLTRGWQGKTIFLSIGLTMIISSLIKLDKEITKKDIIILALANLFSLSLSSTAIFLIPFTYLAFGILKLVQKKWKDIGFLIISFIPVIIYVLILFVLIKCSADSFTVLRNEVSILDYIKFYKNYTFLIYYIIATAIILKIGDTQAKRYFGIITLINLCTIWNPMLSKIISKYLTGTEIFWRVLWLVPIEFAITYAITKGIQIVENKKIKFGILIVSTLIIIVTGTFIYADFKPIENLENIPQEIIDQTNYILSQSENQNEVMVLTPQEPLHSCTMRQISTKIKLINSRAHYMKKLKDDEIEERVNLSQIYVHNYVYNKDEFYELVKKYKICWIIVEADDTDLIEYVQSSNIKENSKIGNYILFKCEIWQ